MGEGRSPAGRTRSQRASARADRSRSPQSGNAREAAAGGGLFARLQALARQIPRGKVATYGQLARIVGTTPRAAGFAMGALTPADRVPWHRVVNSRGETSLRGAGGAEQRARLEAEGVRFDARGRIDLERWGWLPREERRRVPRGPGPSRRKVRSPRGRRSALEP